MMPARRRAPSVSTRIVPLRATDAEVALLDRLAEHLGLSGRSEVVRYALAAWAETPEGSEAVRACIGPDEAR